jgi:hypothetical protein
MTMKTAEHVRKNILLLENLLTFGICRECQRNLVQDRYLMIMTFVRLYYFITWFGRISFQIRIKNLFFTWFGNTQFKWNHSTVLSSCSHHYLLKFKRSTNYYIRRWIWRQQQHTTSNKRAVTIPIYIQRNSAVNTT